MRRRLFGPAPTVLGVAIALAILTLSFCSPTRPPAVTDDGIVVDASRAIGALATELDTQIIYPGVLSGAPDGAAKLSDYAPKVRLILGTDGAYLPDHPPTLPAGWTKGAWDFRTLDELVGAAFQAGAQPVLDIGYMPDWLWDCATGRPLDPTYAAFGEYAARLVSYYNRGSFVAEDGRVIANPAGTAHRVETWEIWNEPDLWTLACVGPSGKGPGLPSLTPSAYLSIWNALAPRMRAVDPAIKLAGPALATGADGAAPAFLEALIGRGVPKPDILTLHSYGTHDERDLDRCVFDGYASGAGCFADGIAALTKTITKYRELGGDRPIWITEANALSSYAIDPRARNWGALGTAWKASVFARMARARVNAIFEYSFVHPGGKQFSVIDPTTGAPLLSYWTHREIAQAFPPGVTMLSTSGLPDGIDALAVRTAAGGVNVLVVNRRVAHPDDFGGTGVAATLTLRISGVPAGGEITTTMLDAQTPIDDGPVAAHEPDGLVATLRFTGYGAAILSYSPSTATRP